MQSSTVDPSYSKKRTSSFAFALRRAGNLRMWWEAARRRRCRGRLWNALCAPESLEAFIARSMENISVRRPCRGDIGSFRCVFRKVGRMVHGRQPCPHARGRTFRHLCLSAVSKRLRQGEGQADSSGICDAFSVMVVIFASSCQLVHMDGEGAHTGQPRWSERGLDQRMPCWSLGLCHPRC